MSDNLEILDVLIVDPNKIVYEGQSVRLFLPGKAGELAVLPGHTPLYTELIQGTVVFEEASGKRQEQLIEGGIARIKQNSVTILVGF